MAMASTTARLVTDGSLSGITGSTVEGQAYARHVINQRDQDIDVMIVEGSIGSEDTLIPTGIPGFVQIKIAGVQVTGDTQLKSKENRDGILCVNGLEMKRTYLQIETADVGPLSKVTANRCTDAQSASVATTLSYQTMELDKDCQEQLANIPPNLTEQHRQKYRLFCEGLLATFSQCAVPLFTNKYTSDTMSAWNLNVDYFRDTISLTGPAYGYRLSRINRSRMDGLLDFYQKYKHLGNAQYCKNRIEYDQNCIPKESDFVPCFQLKFWPEDVKPFLERIRKKRSDLFDLIESDKTSMHVIQKWSTKTPEVDKEIEFRYSFSFIERLLAKNRTEKEQILNGVARSIYYRYLKDKCRLPSYFIKTSVLWMCENINVNDCRDAKEIAEKWLKYACELLKNKQCPHYFIHNTNIFAPYLEDGLIDRARQILMTDVRLDEPITMNILDQQQQIICKLNQNNINFISQLKVRDLLNALSDYRSLRRNWPDNEVPQISITNEDVHECLHILNILRFIDGDKFQNLPEFCRIFLEEELNRCTNEPLWGESANKCSPSEFVNGLIGVIFYLKAINEAMNDSQFTGQYIGVNPRTFQSYQNVMQDMTNPENIMQNLLTKLVPMLADDPEKTSSLIERTLLAHHPGGPMLNFGQRTSIASTNEQHEPPHHQTKTDIIRTLESAPDPNMTIAELNEHQSRVKNQRQQEADLQEADDQLLALTIQKSLEEF